MLYVSLNTLNNLGYTVDFTVINSAEMGVPQNRERTYILGIKDFKEEKFKNDYRNNKINSLKKELNNSEFKGFNFFESLKVKKKGIYKRCD